MRRMASMTKLLPVTLETKGKLREAPRKFRPIRTSLLERAVFAAR
jgi:hypothetical protein